MRLAIVRVKKACERRLSPKGHTASTSDFPEEKDTEKQKDKKQSDSHADTSRSDRDTKMGFLLRTARHYRVPGILTADRPLGSRCLLGLYTSHSFDVFKRKERRKKNVLSRGGIRLLASPLRDVSTETLKRLDFINDRLYLIITHVLYNVVLRRG